MMPSLSIRVSRSITEQPRAAFARITMDRTHRPGTRGRVLMRGLQMTTFRAVAAVVAMGVLGATAGARVAAQKPTPIKVYKTPTCGCCGKWVEHLRANGFAPDVTEMD